MSRSKIRRTLRYSIYGLLVAALVGALLLASRPRPTIVDLASVTRGRVAVVVEDSGRTRVIDRYMVSAPIMGALSRITLSPGDPVEAEAEVGHLNSLETGLLDARSRARAEVTVAAAVATQSKLRAEVGRVEAAAEFAATELERVEALAAAGGMSEREADRARFEARSAKEALESARFGARVADHEVRLARAALTRGKHHEVLTLRSPVKGVVLRLFEESAGVVQAGQPILEIGDPSRLEVVVDILTTEAVLVEPGDPVELIRWGRAEALSGQVRIVEPSAFTKRSALGVEEQRVHVVIDILDSPEARAGLADGFRVEARIEVAAVEDVTRVPSSALFRVDDAWAVYVAREGVAEQRQVEIGLRGPELSEITAGLEEGERVVIHPGSAIADGAPIEPRG